MAVKLLHHPFARAANTVWALEEVGSDYELEYVNLGQGDQKKTTITTVNPMGEIPTLFDGDVLEG
jgi:glutathione S-transferase